jgi:ribosome-binding factor A
MSTRTAQVEAAIGRALGDVIPELHDPRIPLLVTIERVQITPDLLHAKVFVSVMVRPGEATDVAATVAALEHAKGFLQRRLGQALQLRRTPLLSFFEAKDAVF